MNNMYDQSLTYTGSNISKDGKPDKDVYQEEF